MLDRVLFAVRRFQLNIGDWLGFWKLSIVLMILAALYYLLLAIWAAASPPHVVRNIALLLPFWVVLIRSVYWQPALFWRCLIWAVKQRRYHWEFPTRLAGYSRACCCFSY